MVGANVLLCHHDRQKAMFGGKTGGKLLDSIVEKLISPIACRLLGTCANGGEVLEKGFMKRRVELSGVGLTFGRYKLNFKSI